MNKLLFHNAPWRSQVSLLNTAGPRVLKEDKGFRLSWHVGFRSVSNRQVPVPVYMAIATWKYRGFRVESASQCSPLAQTSCFQCSYMCWWAVKSSLPQGTKRHPVALSFGNPWDAVHHVPGFQSLPMYLWTLLLLAWTPFCLFLSLCHVSNLSKTFW